MSHDSVVLKSKTNSFSTELRKCRIVPFAARNTVVNSDIFCLLGYLEEPSFSIAVASGRLITNASSLARICNDRLVDLIEPPDKTPDLLANLVT